MIYDELDAIDDALWQLYWDIDPNSKEWCEEDVPKKKLIQVLEKILEDTRACLENIKAENDPLYTPSCTLDLYRRAREEAKAG